MDFDVRGIVTKTSNDSCDVSICIDGVTKSLSFGRTIFYPYGKRCERNMDDVLSVGMEVDLRYKIFRGDEPCILAVWIFSRPEFFKENSNAIKNEERSLSSLDSNVKRETQADNTVSSNDYVVLYNDIPLTGTISPLADNTACINYEQFKILVRYENFYLNGQRPSAGEFSWFSHSKKTVQFEAIPVKFMDFTHESSCAWVGRKPSLPRMLSFMHPPKLDLLKKNGRVFSGCVVKLCLPEVALAAIVEELTFVIIHVSHIQSGPIYKPKARDDLITDFVRVEDSIQFKIEKTPRNLLYGWDVHVKEDTGGENLSVSGSADPCKNAEAGILSVKRNPVVDEPCTGTIAGVNQCSVSRTARRTARCQERSARFHAKKTAEALMNAAPGTPPSGLAAIENNYGVDFVVKANDYASSSNDEAVLYNKDPPLTGIICQPYDRAFIEYKQWRIILNQEDLYVNGQKCSLNDLMSHSVLSANYVNFEAIATKLVGYTHETTCVWIGTKPELPAISSSFPPPKLALVKEWGQVFYGFVSKLHLPEVALVLIPGESTIVRIPVSHIQGEPTYMPGGGLITNFVRLKDCVQFRILSPMMENLFGWDVRVMPFSKETWERANGGVFLSRGPFVNPGLRFVVQGPDFDEPSKADTSGIKKHCSPIQRPSRKKFQAKKTVKVLMKNAADVSLDVEASCLPNADAKASSTITNAELVDAEKAVVEGNSGNADARQQETEKVAESFKNQAAAESLVSDAPKPRPKTPMPEKKKNCILS